MKARIVLSFALATAALGGCSNSGSLTPISTASVGGSASSTAPKTDPACVSLATQIDTLRADGVAEKVEKAAAKKYKMKATDLADADKLNKANAEFQVKCAPNIPRPAPAQSAAATGTSGVTGPAGPAPSAPAKSSTGGTGAAPEAKPKTVKPVAALQSEPKPQKAQAKSEVNKPQPTEVTTTSLAPSPTPAPQPTSRTASAADGPDLPAGISIGGQ